MSRACSPWAPSIKTPPTGIGNIRVSSSERLSGGSSSSAETPFAAQVLGVANQCIETIIDYAQRSPVGGPMPSLRERTAPQRLVSAHETTVAAACRRLHDCVETLWGQTVDRGNAEHGASADAYAGADHANRAARRAIDDMFDRGGTRSLYSEGPLERSQRDLPAMLRYVVAQLAWVEEAGRVRFRLEPENPLSPV